MSNHFLVHAGFLPTVLPVGVWWPRTRKSWPRVLLDEATRKLFATRAKLYRAYRGLLSGRGTAESSRPLRMQGLELLSQREQALRAAQHLRLWAKDDSTVSVGKAETAGQFLSREAPLSPSGGGGW